ncbi:MULTISPECIES: ParA family partition ATPase [Alphaproteobacteria]|jgi:chromosome partitioning protein|uniref:ParA family partition ATPase n=2 Tax=Pseudomonadota TaxID=1224 RepID=UPI00045A0294|nr:MULTISPECIES: ParA family partition ATPase [Alphaproteobacteria]MDT8356557.1 ParA family partition ATPase [Roseomonas mucosa]CDN96152.1 Cobyrinic acid ac-diamide synthase [Agrobacterium tumefaciens]CEJ16316.1 Chromosome partitioning protein ParA [bacterium YEK0313]
MNVIAFLSQKGGSGKTTLSVHTAVAAEATGERVCVIDADPQESATAWANAREAGTPIVATAQAGELDAALRAAEGEGMTLAVVDAPPHAAPAAGQIARRSELVLIPVRPSAFDLAAVPAAVEIVVAAKVRGAFVLSACPFRAPEIGETRAALEAYGLPIVPGEITDRRAFARAVTTGSAVTEFEAEGKAAEEIRALWAWIKDTLERK